MTFHLSPNIPLMTDAHRLFNIIDKRMAISYNSTELFIETGCIIEAETSAATSTPVSGPKPSILAAEARAACSKAESTEEEYTDLQFFISLYAERNLNGSCFEAAT